ncbi:ArnT family glycosyltransferase [uncultured Sphingomonas sp.]|uniref:ArnT family glycosyltransferase n=1 Tax=uncultured Sphingomonas sp. TaxID=158754 RepID=UPI0035CC5ED5
MTVHTPIVAGSNVRSRRLVRPAVSAAIVLLVAAIILRRGQFGNPIAGLDEQLYLLIGDRLWHGELPYVDLWDRKPFGLFMLFAAIRLLPGDGVLAAQIVATCFAAGTAWFVFLLARREVGWSAATMAGLFHLAAQIELWGDTTQTPVFYNLPIIAAAWLTLRAEADPLMARSRREMIGAVLLAGCALQLKTNAVFEGAFFAAWYLWRVSETACSNTVAIRWAGQLAAVGAAPTFAVVAYYAMVGFLPAWWHANVLSVIAKGRPDDLAVGSMLGETVVLVAPILLLALLGVWARTRRFTHWDRGTAFRLGWIAVASVDFAAIGGYYPHYALPLLLAATPLIAEAFNVRRSGPALFLGVMVWPTLHTQYFMPRIGLAERVIARTVLQALPADVTTRCLLIYEGPVAYYHLTDACRVTRFAFSAHLSSNREQAALGVDPKAELDAAMARRPGTVITVDAPPRPDRAMEMEQHLKRLLLREYHVVARLPHRYFTPDERLVIWRRD